MGSRGGQAIHRAVIRYEDNPTDGKRSTMDLINRTFTSDGHSRGVGFPYNYHNSFWSNYFANYWHPSSYYQQQLECPDPVPLLPGLYSAYDPLLARPEPSVNIRSRSRQFYSAMVITRSYPSVNIWTRTKIAKIRNMRIKLK